MKAMILAAGKGTRLGQLTSERPKCLIEVGGKAMIDHVITNLIAAGVRKLVVNVHHHAEQVISHVRAAGYNVPIEIVEEDRLFDTGGSIRNARKHLEGPEPFFVHNCDIYMEADLASAHRAHVTSGNAVSLLVMQRSSSRGLFFDEKMQLVGWDDTSKGKEVCIREVIERRRLSYSGVQVISPMAFQWMDEYPEFFSIVDVWLKLAKGGQSVAGFDIGKGFWIDMGSPEKLAKLQAHLGHA
jgi:NDP-sugar pyrophosphorylase family protein